MASKTRFPHDEFVRAIMIDLDLVRRFMRHFLATSVLTLLDLDKIEYERESYFSPDLREVVTDVTFRVPIKGKNTYISFVLEHKSTGSLTGKKAFLPFQLRIQEIEIMRAKQLNHPEGLVPMVRLIALVHGDHEYDGPLSVGERMEGPKELVPPRWSNQDFELIDLSKFADDELSEDPKLSMFLLSLKHIYDKNIVGILRKWLSRLRQLEGSQGGKNFLIALFTYLLTGSKGEKKQEVVQFALESFTEETGGDVMSILEAEYQEGVKEGVKEEAARAEAKAAREKEETARRMYTDGLDIATISNYMGLPITELEKLLLPKAS